MGAIAAINKENERLQMYIDSVGVDIYKEMKYAYVNESLEDLTTNRIEENKMIVMDGEIFQNDDPVYNNPKGVSFFNTHFYAPNKYLFGNKIGTFYANLIIIWCFSILTYIALYYDVLKKLVDGSVNLMNRLRPKKAPIRI
jgi:hypothetical protein